jgi:RND family efflux transporter MFP subunit
MRSAPALATVASNTIRTPLLLGPLRPLVVLPADATARHSPAELRLMLAHELAHLRRGDLWWNWLPAAAQTLLFFHPLVWLAAREWRLAQESACDEAAVAATGASPARYGDMLLAVLSAPSANRSVFISLPATAAAGVAESLSTLQRRLTAMKHFPAAPCRTRVRRAFACAFFVIGCTAIAPWSVVARQPDPANAGRGDREAAMSPGPAEAAQPDAEPVPAGAPAPARTTAPGYLRSAEANLAAASEGIVTQVGAEVGQSVKKGQLIVKLNDRKAQLALQAAKAKLAEVNAKARRVKELYEAKQLSEAELERTTAEREQAQVELALREQDLEEMRVISPLDGAVEKLSVQPGEYVARGGEVARVVALDAFWADVNVATDTAAGIKPGDPAAVQLGRRQGWSLKGRVRFVSSVVRSGSQSTLVRVDVLDPPPGLKPGMEVVVEFGGGK